MNKVERERICGALNVSRSVTVYLQFELANAILATCHGFGRFDVLRLEGGDLGGRFKSYCVELRDLFVLICRRVLKLLDNGVLLP